MSAPTDTLAGSMHAVAVGTTSLEAPPVVSSTKPEAGLKHHGPPFRLLDLPNEIQLNVIQKHYEGSKLQFQSDPEGNLTCKTFSSLKLECVGKHVRDMCLKTRNEKIEKKLTFEVPLHTDNFVQAFAVQSRFSWIRNHVTNILFSQAPDFPSPPDWQLLCTSVPNLYGVGYVCLFPCTAGNGPVGVILKTASKDLDALTAMVVEGVLDQAAPLLTNNSSITDLCKSLDRSRSQPTAVSLIALFQFKTNDAQPLFSMRITQLMTAKGLEKEEKRVYMPDGSHIALGTVLPQPIITDARGIPRFYTEPTTPFQVPLDDVHDLLSAMGINPEEVLNNLNSNEEEYNVFEEAEVAEGAAEHQAD